MYVKDGMIAHKTGISVVPPSYHPWDAFKSSTQDPSVNIHPTPNKGASQAAITWLMGRPLLSRLTPPRSDTLQMRIRSGTSVIYQWSGGYALL